jgi:Cu/Ag efflux protein CusF
MEGKEMRATAVVVAVLTGTGVIWAASCPAQAQTAPSVTSVVATGPGTAAGVVTVEATATVTAVDAANRTVTLRRANGKIVTIDAGEEVKNFNQIKVGDTVRAKYTAALALELKKEVKGHGQPTEEAAATSAPLGAKPAATVGRKVTAMTDVTAVDHKKQLVTLRGPAGKEYDLNVQDPAQLKNIKVGDHVQVTYAEGLAISVEETHPAGAGAKK